jgi:hypothetical protein
MQVTGTFILAGTNWICWTAIALLVHWAWVLTRTRRVHSPDEPGGEPP